jgi:hypothetical protein
MSGFTSLAITQHLLVPALVDLAPGPREITLDPARLHAVPVAEFPLEIAHVDKVAKTRMKGIDVIILEIDFDESLPVALILVHFNAVEYKSREVELVGDTESGEILSCIALPGEQQSMP